MDRTPVTPARLLPFSLRDHKGEWQEMKEKRKRNRELRFNYFYRDPVLYYQYSQKNAWDLSERENLRLLDIYLGEGRSDHFREEFERGQEEAIYDFVGEDPSCFQFSWVTDQIEKWRIENSFKSIIKLRRLLGAYIPEQRGKTISDELEKIVKRDRDIYLRILELKKTPPRRSVETIIGLVAGEIKDSDSRNESSMWSVYKAYNKALKELFDGDEKEFIRYLKKNPLDKILKRGNALSLSMDYRCSYCLKRVVLKKNRKSTQRVETGGTRNP